MMKRFFLIMAALIALVAFPACKSCGKDQSVPKQGLVTQTAPKDLGAKLPGTTQPKVDTMAPKNVRPKTVQPKAVTPKVEPTPEPPKTAVLPTPEPPKITPPESPKVVQPVPQVPRVSIVDYWVVRRPSGTVRDMFAITFVVKNATAKNVKVKVVCHYVDGSLFGESIPQTVDANSDAKLMVRGFKRCPSGLECHESFDCQVQPVR